MCQNRHMKSRFLIISTAVVATSFALGACSDDIPADGDENPSTLTSSDGGTSEQASPMPENVPPGLLECGNPLEEAEGYHLIEADLTEASWEAPQGWINNEAYVEEKPVEKLEITWTVEPEENPVQLNVLNVMVYSGIEWAEEKDECGRVPVSAISDRLDEYNERIGARIVKEAEFIEFAGAPAITQDVTIESNDPKIEDYTYTGVWLFSQTHLLHTYCQWTTEEELVRQACEDLYDSFQLPENTE